MISKPHGGVRPFAAPVRIAVAPAATSGAVSAFHDNDGRLLTHCRIVLIYWGSAWSNTGTSPSAADFTKALTGIVAGPWGTQLGQYRGIGPMSIERTTLVTGSDPNSQFSNAEIQAMLSAQIDNGTLPAPDNAIDRVYCVLMPTGHSSKDTSYVGQHQKFDKNGVTIYYAWITNDGTLTGGNSVPKVFCHELAEALSDPDLGSGILVDADGETNQEIGDVCNDVFSIVDGAAEEAYWSNADNRCVLPVAQTFPAVAANPVLLQGRFGRQGNFELLSAARDSGLLHFFRNNDNPFLPWSAATQFGSTLGQVEAVTMIQSNFGDPGNLEVVARAGEQLYFFFRDSGPAFAWNGPFAFGAGGVSGNPVLIQSRFGRQGNFELLVPLAAGGLASYFRNNDDPAFPWSPPFPFGQSLGHVDAATMIQSNFGSPGNLEVVARSGDQLFFFFRDSGPEFRWNGPFAFGSRGVSGNPVLIQSRFGQQGNFELLVPLSEGGLAFYFRNNDDPAFPWSGPTVFGQSLGQVDAVTMIQSNYGTPGNLEVIARSGDKLFFFFRDSGPAFNWSGPIPLQSVVW